MIHTHLKANQNGKTNKSVRVGAHWALGSFTPKQKHSRHFNYNDLLHHGLHYQPPPREVGQRWIPQKMQIKAELS